MRHSSNNKCIRWRCNGIQITMSPCEAMKLPKALESQVSDLIPSVRGWYIQDLMIRMKTVIWISYAKKRFCSKARKCLHIWHFVTILEEIRMKEWREKQWTRLACSPQTLEPTQFTCVQWKMHLLPKLFSNDSNIQFKLYKMNIEKLLLYIIANISSNRVGRPNQYNSSSNVSLVRLHRYKTEIKKLNELEPCFLTHDTVSHLRWG